MKKPRPKRVESFDDCAGIPTQATRPRVHALSLDDLLSFHGLSEPLTEEVEREPCTHLLIIVVREPEKPRAHGATRGEARGFRWNKQSHLVARAGAGALF